MIAPQIALIVSCSYAIIAIMIVALAPTFPFIIQVLESIFNPLNSIIEDVEVDEQKKEDAREYEREQLEKQYARELEQLEYSCFEVIEPAATIYGELKYRNVGGLPAQVKLSNYSYYQCVSDECRIFCTCK